MDDDGDDADDDDDDDNDDDDDDDDHDAYSLKPLLVMTPTLPPLATRTLYGNIRHV